MTDRYLFRGKRADNGEWVYGGIYHQPKDEVKDENFYIIGGSLNDVGCAYEVIPETVGQCTGLKDKNGKLIYEDDILIFTNDDGEKTPYEVQWSEKYAGYVIAMRNGAVDTMDGWDEYYQYFEIIGNIHDNPELLEVKE